MVAVSSSLKHSVEFCAQSVTRSFSCGMLDPGAVSKSFGLEIPLTWEIGTMSLIELWLPILLSAVLVFVVSSILHMVISIHKGDFKKLPGEEKVLEVMRAQGVQPGSYMFPCAASMKAMGSPVMVENCEQGPVGFLQVVPSGPRGLP